MNGPFRVAQATTGSQSAAKTPSRTVKLSKPYADQSVSVSLSYDGTVKADFSAIANEKITLVHVGEKLIILFDNKSMLTLEPFFDSNGKPLGNVSVEVSPGRDLTGAEFAALFPVTEDQSVLPAAGAGTGNAQSSGANFSSVGVDPLSLPNPLDLLGPTELPGFTITNLLNQPFINDVPTVSANAAVLFDEDGLPGGNLAGIADLDPSSNGPTTLTGTLGFTFGQDGAGTVLLLGTGAPAGFTYSLDPTSTILTVSQLQDGVIVNVLQITLNDATSGNYTITQLNPIRHAAGGDENDQDFTFNYQVTDSNGDFVVGTLSLSVDDDTPTIDVEVTEGEGGPSQLFLNPFDESIGNDPNNIGIPGTIDDVGSAPDLTGTTPFGEIKSNLPGEGQNNQLAALFNIISSPGSDGEQITTQAFSLTLTGGVNGPPVATNLTATALSGTALAGLDATERAIVLVQVSPTVVEARVVGDANVVGDEFVVLRFTVINPNDPATVQLIVHQFLPIDHGADGNNFDSSLPLLISQVGASLGLTMSATIIDNDGDPATASETVVIAGNGPFSSINIEDDGPELLTPPPSTGGGEGGGSIPQSISLALDETIGTDRYNNLPLPNGEPESNGDQPNGTPDDTAAVVSAPSTDPDDSAAFGRITTAAGAIGSNFPVLTPDFGTDGPGPNDGFSQELSFVLTGSATNLRVTKLDNTPLENLTDAQRNIVLTLEDGAIVGRVVGTASADDNFVVFRITIQNATDPSMATITVEQFLPLDHGSDATSLFDESIPLLLTDQGSLSLQLVTTISDGDTDSIVQTDTIGLIGEGSFLTFDDDGPKVSVSVNASFALAHDETSLVQGDANDVLLPSPLTLFAPVLFKGADPHTLGLPLGFARSTTAALTIGGVDFGSDGAALTNSQVFSLTLSLNGQPTNVLATDLKTTEGRAIFLFQEGPFIVGRFDVAGGVVGSTDPAAFALTINPATGIVSLAQYVSLQHPIGGASHDEPVSLTNLTSFVGTGTGAINATLTVTDGDGDKASASASIGSTVTFQDDGPSFLVPANANPLFRLTVDESAGNQADDVTGPITAFDGVTNVGIDPDAPVANQPLAFATDANTALVFVPFFGVDGPAPQPTVSYSLVLNDLDNVPGVPSGVKVSDGTATGTSVTLFEESGIIVGRVDGGVFAGKAAFAIAINPANGQVSIVQYLSLQHPNDTNPDDEISLLSGILQARVTIKDGDNDTAQSNSDISGRIVFRDDGPTLIASRPFVANVDEDGLHTSGNPPTSTLSDSNVDANRDGEVTGTNSNVYEGGPGTLNALVNFGADGFGSFSLNATLSPQATGLFSKDAEIFIQSNGTLLEGYADNRLVFTLTVGADGSFKFTLLDQINHPTLDGTEEGDGDDSENLLDVTGIDLSSYVTAKDGDGDGIPLGSGSFVIQVRDDIPVATNGTVALGTVYEDGLTATNSNDQSVGNPETDHTEVSVIITSDQLKTLVSAGADEDVTFSLNGAVGNPLGLTSHNIPVTYLVSGNTLTAKAGANTVFTIEDNLDGTFTFTLLDQLDHLPLGSGAGDDEPLTLNLAAAFKATDFDGDSVVLTGALNLIVENDVPTAVQTTVPLGTVYEDGLNNASSIGNSETGHTQISVTITSLQLKPLVSVGADEDVTFSLNEAVGNPSGLKSHDLDVTYSVVGNTLTAKAGANTVFTIVDNNDGTFTFTLKDQLDHGELDEGGGDEETLILNLAAAFKATDFDGDSVVLNGTLSLLVENDIPKALQTTVELGTVYEDGLNNTQSVGIPESGHTQILATITSAQLKTLVSAGADEDVTFSLNELVGNPAGLKSHDIAVTYSVVGNTLTASAGANTVFTIVDNLDGSFTFTLKDQLDHGPLATGGGDNEALVLNLASAFKATDFDGDSIALNGTLSLTVENDVPELTARPAGVTQTEVKETLSFDLKGGNDVVGGVSTNSTKGIWATGIDVIDNDDTANTSNNSIGIGDGQIIDGQETKGNKTTGPEILTLEFFENVFIPNGNTPPSHGAAYDVNKFRFSIDAAEAQNNDDAVVFVSVLNNGNVVAPANYVITINGGTPAAANVTVHNVFNGATLIGFVFENVPDDADFQISGNTGIVFDTVKVGNYNGFTFTSDNGGSKTVSTGNSFKVYGLEADIVTIVNTLETFKISHDESPGFAQDTPNLANDVDPAVFTPPGTIAGATIGYARSAGSVTATGSLFSGKDGADEVAKYSFAITDANGAAITNVNSGLKALNGAPILLSTDANGVLVGSINGGATVIFKVTVDASGFVWIAQFAPIAHDLDGAGAAAHDDIATVTAALHITGTLTDFDGDKITKTSPVALKVEFQDDGPVANDDFDSISEDGPLATGNVFTGIEPAPVNSQDGNNTDGVADNAGTDGVGSVVWAGASNSAVAGTYGVLTVSSNGTYTYVLYNAGQNPTAYATVQGLDVGQTLTEEFGYQLVDGDGDTDLATLTITITGTNDTPTVTVDQGNPFGANDFTAEGALAIGSNPGSNLEFASGTFTVGDPDGLDDLVSVTINGKTVLIGALQGAFFDGSFGTLTVTNYNAATGVASYTYELKTPTTDVPNVTEHDSFTFSVFDGTVNSASASINIDILDDQPQAKPDTDSVQSGATTAGNVITDAENNGDNGQDVRGADGIATIVWANAVGNTVTTPLGVLTIGANGAYSYKANPNVSGIDTLSYTITDGDGDPSTTTLTITVADGRPVPVAATNQVNEAALDLIQDDRAGTSLDDLAPGTVKGTNQASGDETVAGTLNLGDPNSPHVTNIAGSVTSSSVGGSAVTVEGTYGFLRIDQDGNYTYTLTKPYDTTPDMEDGPAIELNRDVFTFTVTDAFNNTATSTISINIVDDVPTVTQAESVSVNEDLLPSDQNPSGIAQASTGFLNINWGADNNSAKHLEFVKDGMGNPVGPSLTSDGTPLLYAIRFPGDSPGNEQIVAYKTGGSADNDADVVFRVTLYEFGTGYYTYVQYQNIDHAVGSDLRTFNFSIKAFDGDGDSVAQTLTINVTDDLPLAANDGTFTVVEDGAGAQNTPPTSSISGDVLANDTAGADGPKAFDAWSTSVTDLATIANLSQYGTLTQNGNGTWSFVLNNALPATQALTSASDLTFTLNYTMKDGDGDKSPATLTIKITGADDTATVVTAQATGADNTVYESGLDAGGSQAGTDNEIDGGSFAISATDGIKEVVIGGTVFTLAQIIAFNGTQTVNTGEGELTLVSYTGNSFGGAINYYYKLLATIDNDSKLDATDTGFDDVVTVTVNGIGGTTGTDSLVITIVDDLPQAANDGPFTVVEDGAGAANTPPTSSISGNVLTNDASGADTPKAFDAWSASNAATITDISQYGTLTLNNDGTWSFVLNNALVATQALTSASNLTFTLNYTMKDADQDTSPATLTIKITGANDTASVVTAEAEGADNTVYESGLDAGGSEAGTDLETSTPASFSISATDGIKEIVIEGITFSLTQIQAFNGSQTVNTGEGVLKLLSYSGDSFSGTVTYSYTLSATIDNDTKLEATGTGFDDSVTITVNGIGGTTDSDSLVIRIVDDTPTAANDGPFTATEDGAGAPNTPPTSSISGNVLTNDASGADTPKAFDAWSASNAATITDISQYGTLTLNNDGTWSFVLNNALVATQALTSASNLTFTLNYTMKDADQDTSPATLTIKITGANDTASVVTAEAEGADNTVYESGLDAGGSEAATNKETTDVDGTFTISATDGMSTVVIGGTSFTRSEILALSITNKTVDTGEGVLTLTGFSGDSFGGTVSYSYTLKATIDNDSHAGATGTEFDDVVTVTVNGIGGTTDSDELVIAIVDDTPKANNDGPVIQSAANENQAVSVNVFANDVAGADGVNLANVTSSNLSGLGSLAYDGNGTFTYTPAPGETGNVTFNYTITDGDNDPSTALVTITLAADSAPTVQTTSVTVDEDGLSGIANVDTSPTLLPTETDSTESASQSGTIVVTYGKDVPANLLAAIQLSTLGLDMQLDALGGDVTWTLSADKLTLTGSVGTTPVMTIAITAANVTNATTGEVTYDYTATLLQPVTHPDNPNEDFVTLSSVTFSVADNDGTVQGGSFDVTVYDDVPEAKNDDAISVLENAAGTIGGTLLANDALGADGATLTHVKLPGSGTFVDISTWPETVSGNGIHTITVTDVGTYTFKSDGTWTLDPVFSSSTSDHDGTFEYRIKDGDGDTSTATQPITVQNASIPFTQTANFTGIVEEEQLNSTQAVGNEDLTSTPDGDNNTATPDGDDDVSGNLTATSAVTSGDLSTMISGLDGTATYGFQVTNGTAATFVGGGEIKSHTQPVILAVVGNTLWGFVNGGGNATEYDSVNDRPVFKIVLDTATGAFTFTLLDSIDHHLATAADNQEGIKSIDLSGLLTVTDSLEPETMVFQNVSVKVIDDVPVAKNDADSLDASAFSSASGNVVSGTGTAAGTANADGVGADGGFVSAIVSDFVGGSATTVPSGVSGATIAGHYGNLTIHQDGSYTYAVTGTGIASAATDVFTYTLKDGDGDTTTAKLTINFPTVDAPTVTLGTGDATLEDTAVTAQFTATPDSNPASTITQISISGLTGWTLGTIVLSNGAVVGSPTITAGTLTINVSGATAGTAVVASVGLTPPANSDVDAVLSMAATSTTGGVVVTSTAVNDTLFVDAVADPVTVDITVTDSNDADGSFSANELGTLNAVATFGDTGDGSETHTVMIQLQSGFLARVDGGTTLPSSGSSWTYGNQTYNYAFTYVAATGVLTVTVPNNAASATFNIGVLAPSTLPATITFDATATATETTISGGGTGASNVDLAGNNVATATDTTGIPVSRQLNATIQTNTNSSEQDMILTFIDKESPLDAYAQVILRAGTGSENAFVADAGFNIDNGSFLVGLENAIPGSKILVRDFVLEGVKIGSGNDQIDYDGNSNKDAAITATISPPATPVAATSSIDGGQNNNTGGSSVTDPDSNVFHYLAGQEGTDTVTGSTGSDIHSGGLGIDTVNAGGGNDVIVYSPGDTMNGGGGFDILRVDQGAIYNTATFQGGSLGSPALSISSAEVTLSGTLSNIDSILLTQESTPDANRGTELNLSITDVLSMTDTDNELSIDYSTDSFGNVGITDKTLFVIGSQGDKLDIDTAAWTLQAGTYASPGGQIFNQYAALSGGNTVLHLYVDQNIQVI